MKGIKFDLIRGPEGRAYRAVGSNLYPVKVEAWLRKLIEFGKLKPSEKETFREELLQFEDTGFSPEAEEDPSDLVFDNLYHNTLNNQFDWEECSKGHDYIYDFYCRLEDEPPFSEKEFLDIIYYFDEEWQE